MVRLTERVGKLSGKMMVYYLSASRYMGLVNFLLIIATFKATYGINISAYILLPVGFILAMLIGIVDYNFVMKHQIAYTNEQNNILAEIQQLRKEIRILRDGEDK